MRIRSTLVPCLALLLVSPAALATPTTLHGRSADVSLELHGFTQDQGPGSLGGTYERLGQFTQPSHGGSPLTLSVLVDTPPAGLDLAGLRAHVLDAYRPRFSGRTPAITASPDGAGFVLEWIETTTTGPQWQFYYEALAGGRWLEIHFSSLGAAPADTTGLRAAATGMLRGVRLAPHA